jgi:putative membrane protein
MREWCYWFWPPLPVWRKLDMSVLVVLLYTVGVAAYLHYVHTSSPKWLGDVGVINAVLLGVLLAFRNKEAYDRWWEGRKLWGQLINDARNLAVKLDTFLMLTPEERQVAATLITEFARSLKRHLRGQGEPGRHAPIEHVQALQRELRRLRSESRLGVYESLSLDAQVDSLLNICGACERIRNSPVPLSYRSLLRHGTILYLATAPWYLAGEYGFWSVGVVGLVAYFLLGTELTAESIENPFGLDGDDLALASYCDTIATSVEGVMKS